MGGFSADAFSRIVGSEHAVDFFERDDWRVNEGFDKRSSKFDSQRAFPDEAGDTLPNLNSKPLCDFLQLGQSQLLKDFSLGNQSLATLA